VAHNAADSAVILKGLTRRFGAVTAVNDLSLAVARGEMFGIVGPDGAGKTTTIRMLCGIIPPSAGTASVMGHDIMHDAAAVKRSIGYLSQRFTLYGDLSVDENIEFFAGIHGVNHFRERREELLAFTRLTPFRSRLAERLSGGMKQKLALACTLIHTPQVIFLDEPTTGVDPVSRREFWHILQSLRKQEITIVMSTPYLDEAERCSRVALLDRGALLRSGTPEELKHAMHGQVVEVVCPGVRRAVELLRSTPGVLEVQAFGDRLHAVVPSAEEGMAAMTGALEAAGVPVQAVRAVPPSLENVFISLLTDRPQPADQP
jgi:ABC-2 type transport system ATP-binding protein